MQLLLCTSHSGRALCLTLIQLAFKIPLRRLKFFICMSKLNSK